MTRFALLLIVVPWLGQTVSAMPACPEGATWTTRSSTSGAEVYCARAANGGAPVPHGPYRRFVVGRSRVVEAGQYWNGAKVGRWQLRDARGSTEVQHAAAIEDGPWREWWHNGRLRSEGRFAAGVQVGEWREWDESGCIAEEWIPLADVSAIEHRIWYSGSWCESWLRAVEIRAPDGRLLEGERYERSGEVRVAFERRGRVGDGVSRQLVRGGLVMSETEMRDGRPHGMAQAYRPRRVVPPLLDLAMRVQFENGEPRGKAIFFHSGGATWLEGEVRGFSGSVPWSPAAGTMSPRWLSWHGLRRTWAPDGSELCTSVFRHGELIEETRRAGAACDAKGETAVSPTAPPRFQRAAEAGAPAFEERVGTPPGGYLERDAWPGPEASAPPR